MAKRETYSTHIECKRCNVSSEARWEENENPVHGNGLERELISVGSGFATGTEKCEDGTPEILCVKCGVAIRE